MDNPTKRRMHVLILGDDEYIFWVASFEDKADAEAAARLANNNMRDPNGYHRLYVQDYPYYVKGSTLDLARIKALVDDEHEDDEMWRLTDEERIDDLDYEEVEKELGRLAESLGGIRPISRQEFEGLPGPRALAVSDWALSLLPELDDIPEELRQDWKTPSPGQLEEPNVK